MSGRDKVVKHTREELAAAAHEMWAHWMNYLFDQCRIEINNGKPITVIPDDLCVRWRRQTDTRYVDLSESEKNSDREIADEFLMPLMEEWFLW